jgi:hypothetical protein
MMTQELSGPILPVEDHVLWWNRGTVPKIAQNIWTHGHWHWMGILSDALQDACCHNQTLWEACRWYHEKTPGTPDYLPGATILQSILSADAHEKFGLPNLDWTMASRLMGMEEECQLQFHNLRPQLQIPDTHWVIPMLKGAKKNPQLTCNTIIAGLKKAGSNVWTWAQNDDLDAVIVPNDRNPHNNARIIAVRRTIEADPENANKSVNQLHREGHAGMKLEGRLWLELGYFCTTGNHLDLANWTLCTGSLNSDGNVPDVSFSSVNGTVDVGLWYPDDAPPNLRSRSVSVLLA